ncbi:hypothetical protein FRC03_002083 [Tulasnella sp. 419]|nr:hypothetical protein FRC02_001533 [Tulasnella sp. 418]KAG8944417.1 hypothetical protein FRC03_002083 [Tulasnella sp. 419]
MTDNEISTSAALNDILTNFADVPNQKKGELFTHEIPWAQRYDYLLSKGYQLRPRYRPGWKASWKRSIPSPKHEDAIPLSVVGKIMDAERISDSTFVMLKTVPSDSPELRITSLLSSQARRSDQSNHSVPLLDVVDDPLDSHRSIMIIPLLRDSRQPPFSSIGDCEEFIEQTLEGIAFLHNFGIAHRDCFVPNILMDARALFPKGWHPQEHSRLRNGLHMSQSSAPKRRAVGGVRYYFIDFGISSQDLTAVTGEKGLLKAPELSDTVPYNPFKVDIWLLGQSYNHMIVEKFKEVDWVKPLIDAMTRDDPLARPDIDECRKQFNEIQEKITSLMRAKRLHPKNAEWKLIELTRDAAYLVSEGLWFITPRRKPLKPFALTERKEDPPSEPEGQSSSSPPIVNETEDLTQVKTLPESEP